MEFLAAANDVSGIYYQQQSMLVTRRGNGRGNARIRRLVSLLDGARKITRRGPAVDRGAARKLVQHG